MYIDVKRNKLHIQYDKLIDIESDRIIGWTPHYINNYASMNLDINGFKNLIKQLDFKPKASDKVKAWYKEEIEKLKKSKKAHEASKFNLPSNLNKELKEYQKLAVNFFLNVPNSIIAYDCGLGKSLVAINCIKALKAKKTLIVCPSYLKFNWCEELLKWSKLKFAVINGRPEQREEQFKIFENSNKNVLIINYEQIRVKLKKNGKVEEINVHKYLQKTKFNLIIWDEAHRLKNRESQMSNGAFALNSKYKLMLTGTPTTKNAGEFYNLFRILDRQRFKSYWTFVKYYMHVSEGMRGYEIGHVTRPKEFKELLNQYMIRRMKEDVASELPDKVFIDCPVIMNEDQERLYKKVLEEYLYPDDNVIESDVERFIRLCQCTQNPCIIGGKDTSIIRDSILDLLEDLPDRVMIGCVYVDMSVNLKESIEKKFKDRKVYIINSKIKHREKIVDEFKQDETGILVTTIKCLSEGANIDCCDYMVYADIEWNYGINAQFENRIHRMTSTRVKTYYRFIVENTVHKYKHRKIMNEKANSQYLLGDKDNSINKIMNDFRRDMLHE